jgi:class 3 adenylate cyclase/tRNA A-37 threonylcarbamoyl transferase component Bud32
MRNIGGRYLLEREIGRGASGSVWVAIDQQLDRRVALKLLRADALEHPVARIRFEREARLIARLHDPHVVQVYDTGVDGAQPFIVMELLEGESLDVRLLRQRRLPFSAVVRIVGEVAKGLSEIHRAGIVHRDLKPANIFMAREGRREVVKVLDFGVAGLVATAEGERAPRTGSSDGPLGTPHYMAPEQLAGGQTVDRRSDVWALGVLAYQMLTGRRPFDGENLLEIGQRVRSGVFPPASSLNPELAPSTIDTFFQRALAVAPEGRHPTAADLASHLFELHDATRAAPTRVLLLDDEPDMELLVRQKFRQRLRDGTMEVYFATDGEAGLELLRRHPDIDVVLTDLNMPGMDGLTFLSRAAEVNPLVRVVVVSAYSDMANIRAAMNRGAFDFLGKPIDFDDLERTIAKCASDASAVRRALESREENGILRTLVGHGVVDRLLSKIRATESLRNESLSGTVLFADVYGFSSVVARETPDVVFAHLNAHFDVFVPEVQARRGTVTRFVGDAVMAVFEGSDHLPRAVEAALSIRERIQALEGTGLARRPGVAIGIDSGSLVVGGSGSVALGRIEHTVLGEPVGVAARLQSIAGENEILVTSRLSAMLPQYRSEPFRTTLLAPQRAVPLARIVGKARPTPRAGEPVTRSSEKLRAVSPSSPSFGGQHQ